MLEGKTRAKSVTVALHIAADLPRLHAVGAELNQVWMNLIDNALDAVAAGGHVEVTASRAPGRVVVRIVDDGPGIPPDQFERLFEPFFTTKDNGKGTGLGLPILRVQDVFFPERLTRVPLAPPEIAGVLNLRGRVVTLISAQQSQCWGIAYRVAPDAWERVASALDHRERGGFDRKRVTVEFREPDRCAVRALAYVATERNPNYLGPASDVEIAAQIRAAHGPSGPNREYALELAVALRSIGAVDDHVFAIADLLTADP